MIPVEARTVSRSVGAVKSAVIFVPLLTVTVPAVLVSNSFRFVAVTVLSVTVTERIWPASLAPPVVTSLSPDKVVLLTVVFRVAISPSEIVAVTAHLVIANIILLASATVTASVIVIATES